MNQLIWLLALFCGTAAAYESENAVPLAVGLAPGKTVLDKVAVRLEGRAVTVSATLANDRAATQRIGWYASTPQFSILGEGEEHLDKSFADVRATFNGQPRKAAVERPATLAVDYRALPRFALADVASSAFTQMVLQHCGDAGAVRRRISAAAGQQVLVERYDLPLPFVQMQDIQLDIVQPAANWLHARPLVALACGLDNAGLQATASGVVAGANEALSILVISVVAGAPDGQ